MLDSERVEMAAVETGRFASEDVVRGRPSGDGEAVVLMSEHEVIDQRLRMYARTRSTLDAAEATDLLRAQQMRLHALFGCATFVEYLDRRCGYAPHTARERLRVALALASLPAMHASMSRGDLAFAHVRELTRVAVAETEDAWLAATAGMTSGQIQREVSCRARGDLPTDPEKPQLRPVAVRFELPPEVAALVREARKALADERGGEVSDADLVETMCRRILDPGTGAEGPAKQIGYRQCPDCLRTQVTGAGRDFDVAPSQAERVDCDVVVLGDLDADQPARTRATFSPRMRAQLFARDGERCVVPGCRSARNLETHHIIPQSEGGPHEMWNACLLCSGHHAARHDGLLSITGRAPHELQFRWTYGPPLVPGLDAQARCAAMRARVEAIFGERLEPRDPLEIAGRRRRKPPGVPRGRACGAVKRGPIT